MGRLTKEARLEREHAVWELRTKRNMTYPQIAAELGITPGQARYVGNALAERYLDEIQKNIEAVIGDQLARLDIVANEAMEAWHKSKGRQVKVIKKVEPVFDKLGFKHETEKTQQTAWESPGDPRFLDVVKSALADQRQLLGIQDGSPEAAAVAELSDQDRLRRLEAMFAKVIVERVPPQQLEAEVVDVSPTYEADSVEDRLDPVLH